MKGKTTAFNSSFHRFLVVLCNYLDNYKCTFSFSYSKWLFKLFKHVKVTVQHFYWIPWFTVDWCMVIGSDIQKLIYMQCRFHLTWYIVICFARNITVILFLNNFSFEVWGFQMGQAPLPQHFFNTSPTPSIYFPHWPTWQWPCFFSLLTSISFYPWILKIRAWSPIFSCKQLYNSDLITFLQESRYCLFLK